MCAGESDAWWEGCDVIHLKDIAAESFGNCFGKLGFPCDL